MLGWRRLVGCIALLSRVVGGLCHGYLAVPAARNVQHNSDWCPHCLNGPRVCGDARGQAHHEAFGKHASPPRIAETYESGGTLKARVVITANHKGRWSLRLCPLKGQSPSSEAKTLGPGCLRLLRRTDGKGAHVYLPANATGSSAVFRLPPGVKCKRCVVQWRWETGNSCNPRGTPRKWRTPYLSTCGARAAPQGEVFTNCADIRII